MVSPYKVKMLPITVKQVQKGNQTLAVQQTAPCAEVFPISNARAETQLNPPVYTAERKARDRESWRLGFPMLLTRIKGNCFTRAICFSPNDSNGNPADPTP